MDILQYLIELLKIHKEIGIEGLGTLYKKKIPGRYDTQNHQFLPPSHILEFTEELVENNHLSQYIQHKRGISKESAKYFIATFVNEIKNSLQKTAEYQLENIGTLKLMDAKLHFTPVQDINIGFDFFALPTVQAAPLSQTVEPEEMEEVAQATTEEQETIPETEQEATSTKEPTEEKTTEIDTNLSSEPEIPEEEDNTASEKETDPRADIETVTPDSKSTETPDAQSERTTSSEQTEPESIDHSITDPAVGIETVIPDAENIEITEEDQSTHSKEEDEPKESAIQATTSIIEDEKDTWNFENKNVVSQEDIQNQTGQLESLLEETNHQTNDGASSTNTSNSASDQDNIKLTATTRDWNFDTADIAPEKPLAPDSNLIGEFDETTEQPVAETTEEKATLPFYLKFIIGLLILAGILVAIYFINPQLFNSFNKSNVNPDQKIAIPVESTPLKTQADSLSFADSIMKNAEEAGLIIEPAKDTLKMTTNITPVTPSVTYDIIVASFAKTSKAEEFISLMKKKGFDAKISTMPGKRKNISIATYNHIDSAQKYVIKFRKQFNNPNIYPQPIKNN